MQNFISLESVRVATPCRADWDKMQGDDKARFCQSCRKNVYNLSQMTREEAENLIREKEGDLCVRFYQRADGTMISGDCPVGKSVQRRPFYGLLAGFAGLMASGAAVFGGAHNPAEVSKTPPTSSARFTMERLREVPVLGALVDRFRPPQQYVTMGAIAFVPPKNAPTMGKIAGPPPTPKPTETPKTK